MLTVNYLTQRLVRLKPSEEWRSEGQGLCFVFPKRGNGAYVWRSEKRSEPLSVGDVFVFDRGIEGELCAPNREPMAFLFFYASMEHLVALFASSEIGLLQNVVERLKNGKRCSANTALARGCHRLLDEAPAQLTLEHRGQLLRIVAAILSEELRDARTWKVGFARMEDRFFHTLENLSTEEIRCLSIDQLARRFGCGRRHLNRLFRQHFGTSVAALKMEIRLLKAIALLQDPAAKVINVAEECGFNHLGLFNTCFKRRFGASPGQWRKACLNGEAGSSASKAQHETCPLQKNGLCPGMGVPFNGRVVSPLVNSLGKQGPPNGTASNGDAVKRAKKSNVPSRRRAARVLL